MTRCFALEESQPFARLACEHAGLSLAPLEERPFEGGEFKLRPLESVRDENTFVIQSLAGDWRLSPGERFFRLLFLLSGLRDNGARELTALIPYLAFARKDRRTKPWDPVSTKFIAEFLECAGVKRVVALDVHNDAAFDNSFRVPTDHLSALPLFAEHLAPQDTHETLTVCSPDIGGVKRAQIFCRLLESHLQRPVELVFIEKARSSGVVTGGAIVGSVQGRSVIILDDLCASGGTLIKAAKACKAAGATLTHVAVTHVPLTKGLQALQNAPEIDSILTTDSVGADFHPPAIAHHTKLVTLSVAPLFAQAMRAAIA